MFHEKKNRNSNVTLISHEKYILFIKFQYDIINKKKLLEWFICNFN